MSQKKSGVLLSYLTLFSKIIIAFFYTPFLIRSIGDSEYGIFSIVGSLLAYIALVDFGINDTTLRYIISVKKDKSNTESKSILGSINIMYLLIGTVILVLGNVIYALIPKLFATSFTLTEVELTQKVFIASCVGLFFTLVFNPLGAILAAYERFVAIKVLELSSYLLTVILSVILLWQGYTILEVVWCTAFITILFIGIKMYWVWRVLKFPFYLTKFNKSYLKKMVSYAAPIFVVVIVEQIYWKLDNIIIGTIVSAAAVTIYAVGFFFQKYILNFATSISRVFIPSLISEISSNASTAVVTQSVIKIARMQLLIVVPVILVLSLFGLEFITLWLGDGYQIAYYVLLAAMIPFSIEIVGNVRNTVFQVNELYWYRSSVILVISFINIAVTILLLKYTGNIVYAALSTGVGLLVGYGVIHLIMKYKGLLDVYHFMKSVWFRGILPIVVLIIVGILINTVPASTWYMLAAKVSVFGTIYAGLFYSYYLNREEKAFMSKTLNKLKISK